MSKFVDFDKLTRLQQAEARRLRPTWSADQFHRFAFWVTASGTISKKPGHHQFSEAEFLKETTLPIGWLEGARPEKGDIHTLKTAVFGLNKEP